MASILVLDQDAGSREFIREILCDYGYEVFAAVSVADAGEHWTHHRIDLALLDARTVELGSGTGASRPSTMRSLHAPVVVLSGDALEVPMPRVVARLEKPVRLQALLHTVHRLLTSPAVADPGARDVPALAPHAAAPGPQGALALFDLPLRAARAAFERLYLEHQLAAARGQVVGLAKQTGLERTHLHRKLRQLGLRGRGIG